jgi:hypothetical protein
MFGHQDDEQMLNEQAQSVSTGQDNTSTATDNSVSEDNQSNLSAPLVPSNDNQSSLSDNQSSQSNDQSADNLLSTTSNNAEELLVIKQQALNQLSPIINHLDQTPEEKFRTTMMMIQASDDQSLIKSAYEAAQQINDEKVKAQALLDIVNEINYFTHPINEN